MKPEQTRQLIEDRWPSKPLASTTQLKEAGIGDRLLTAAVRHGVVIRVRRGAYARSLYWNGLKPWARDGLLVHAHHLSTGGTALYSHVSAARLHECQVWNAGPLIHVTTSYANSRASAGTDVRTHRAGPRESDTTTFLAPYGRIIRATSLERTVLDCARILPLEQAAVIGDHALRKGAKLAEIQRLLNIGPEKRGSRKARILLDALDGRSESAGETRTRLLLHALAIRSFMPQCEIRTASGLFRADFADPKARTIIEFDGAGKYTEYRPTEEVLPAERRRENALIEDGWLVLRLQWHHLDRPAELKLRLQAITERSRRMSA
ncbi:very-short-patch-repair endonuclease [Pseudarthrobacter sp. W1I19]|uniref:type IV toxin-antitoxin system AbiEi family antitoxin domain-containing protein n=1 Tax=Pseudarthrobacter sp. W1I19 TaxID=3042288 RepID=UPI00277D60AC|nr:type IV toxin-antitoxin system AbiEi family antitoxin domain-containing protein [Pseudarthrobacter sp. W1I19]MDQ0922528.1 very-short-patch-repair endonuclease [Pseudarthrobacter sp. W1I19]